MTKGHYHLVRDTAEIYYCLQGKGALLMENEAGETSLEELRPGHVTYVTPKWAHRSINTGEDDLITFLFIREMLDTITPPLTPAASASGFSSGTVFRHWLTIRMLWIKEATLNGAGFKDMPRSCDANDLRIV